MRLVSVLLLFILTWGHSLDAQEPRPRNIRIEIEIQRVGYEQIRGVSQTFKETTRQFITTLEGYEATIFIGKRIPQIIPLRQYLVEHGYLEYAIQMIDVGTRLRAVPRIKGNLIEVEIMPEISYQTADDKRQNVVQVRSLGSTVLVPNGGTIQLGTVVSDSEFFDHFYRNARGERLVIFLTPTILE